MMRVEYFKVIKATSEQRKGNSITYIVEKTITEMGNEFCVVSKKWKPAELRTWLATY
jgi:hypothetical protein